MANLIDKYNRKSLEIAPLSLDDLNPGGGYQFIIRDNNETIFENKYPVDIDSPDGYYYVYRLIKALQYASQLPGSKTEFNLSLSQEKKMSEPTTLVCDTGWCTFIIWSENIEPPNLETDEIVLKIFYLINPDDEIRHFAEQFMICKAEDVLRFGNEMASEASAARLERIAIGAVVMGDDYVIFE